MIKFDEITEYVVLNNFMKGVAFLPNSKSQTEEDSFEYAYIQKNNLLHEYVYFINEYLNHF